MKQLCRGIALAVFIAASTSAVAQLQRPLRANETYCLEVADEIGGGQPLLCRFVTWEQCMASRTIQGDRCMLNPYLAFGRRDLHRSR